MAKSIVSIVKDPDIEKMVVETIDLLGGLDSLIKSNSVVVLKPNAGHPFPPETSVNTNVDLVSCVIKEIKKAKPKEIILAEASARGCDTLECLDVSGIGKAAENAGVDRIIDIKSDRSVLVRVDEGVRWSYTSAEAEELSVALLNELKELSKTL